LLLLVYGLQILNKSVGWVSLLGLVYTYLPGVLVCYMQLITRKASLRLPSWMKAWMDGRKQLGLLSLAASERVYLSSFAATYIHVRSKQAYLGFLYCFSDLPAAMCFLSSAAAADIYI
jgi:hypothetical protein